MDSRRPTEAGPSAEASDFIRFCYRRRRARWPELYDEMCAVASRGLYRGWGFDELAEHGVAFSLFDMPRLAMVVAQIAGEEGDRRLRGHGPGGSGPEHAERRARATDSRLMAAAGAR